MNFEIAVNVIRMASHVNFVHLFICILRFDMYLGLLLFPLYLLMKLVKVLRVSLSVTLLLFICLPLLVCLFTLNRNVIVKR